MNRKDATTAMDTTERHIEGVAAARGGTAIKVRRLQPLDAAQELAYLENGDRSRYFLQNWNAKHTKDAINRHVNT